jgi:hypothetical protein
VPALPSSLFEAVWVQFDALLPERPGVRPDYPLGRADGVQSAALIHQTLRDVEERALAGLSLEGARAVLRALREARR